MELQFDKMKIANDIRHRKADKEPSKTPFDRQQKFKHKFMKLQAKEQLRVSQKHRNKLQLKQVKHQEHEAPKSPDWTIVGGQDDSRHTKEKLLRPRRDVKTKIHKSKLERVLHSDLLHSLPLNIGPANIEHYTQAVNSTSHLEREFQQTMQLNSGQEQQGNQPQELVLVSYNGEEVPSETGIVAYDENGQLLLIRESDIKSVNSQGNQHSIHTFDGTIYIIDSRTEITESHYILVDRSLLQNDPLASSSIDNDYTLQINEWDEFEIYQAMTAFRIAETNETSSVLTQPPIMSTMETPSALSHSSHISKSNRRSNEFNWSTQSIDDSLAKIGVVTSQSSAIPPSLQLPPTVTNPVITSTVANTVESNDCKRVIYTSNEYWQ